MELKRLTYPIPSIPPEERASLLPPRSICSVAPAEDPSDAFFTGNGAHRIDVTGRPYADGLTANMELLQEPKWRTTPQPPDLRSCLGEIRKALLEGKPEVADRLLEQAQREAGHGEYMDLDAPISYPIESLRTHEAFRLSFLREKAGGTRDYLRWIFAAAGSSPAGRTTGGPLKTNISASAPVTLSLPA